MLEGLRKAQQNWIGKIVITIMFGFLIVSFGFWGISGFLGGGQSTTAAQVGKTTVSVYQLQSALRRQTQQIARATGKPLSPRDVQAMGLDSQVLAQMVAEATIDESARKIGLAASDEMVRQSIFTLPAFQGAGGFNRIAFDSYLRNSDMSEADFVREQKAILTRGQVVSALASGLSAPGAMRDITFRLANERRDVAYFVLTEASAGDIPAPTSAQLEQTYQDNKASFRAPEYRSFEALSVQPSSLAKPDSVSDDDARKVYEELKTTRYASGERRTIQQIVFPTEKEAQDALARLKAGSVTFEALGEERKLAPEALTIGNLTRQEVLDPKIADAAFSLQKDTFSEPVQSRFGFALVRVTAIDAGGFKNFDDVKAEVKAQVAHDRARQQVDRLRDDIEDMVVNARPLAEIAQQKNIPLIQVKAVDRAGLGLDGKPVAGLPDGEKLVAAVFASDIGVDNDMLRTEDGGYIWYQLSNITPARDRTLAEVSTEVAAIWRQNQIQDILSALASKYVAQIHSADDLNRVAAELKVEAKSAQQLARTGQPAADLGPSGLTRLFATPVGKAGSVDSGTNRVVFLVTSATIPPIDANDARIRQMDGQLADIVTNDLLIEYIARMQKDLGVTVNQQMVRRAFGGGGEP